jgi:hypothetical protein
MESFEKEQILMDEIIATIEHVVQESSLTYAQIFGVLEMIKNHYMRENEVECMEGE